MLLALASLLSYIFFSQIKKPQTKKGPKQTLNKHSPPSKDTPKKPQPANCPWSSNEETLKLCQCTLAEEYVHIKLLCMYLCIIHVLLSKSILICKREKLILIYTLHILSRLWQAFCLLAHKMCSPVHYLMPWDALKGLGCYEHLEGEYKQDFVS